MHITPAASIEPKPGRPDGSSPWDSDSGASSTSDAGTFSEAEDSDSSGRISTLDVSSAVSALIAKGEKATLSAVTESYLGVSKISSSSVSRITKELDEKVEEFISRPIEHEIPYLYIDVTYFKVRNGLHYENKALFIVVGVRDDGYREILGEKLADSEILCSGKISLMI